MNGIHKELEKLMRNGLLLPSAVVDAARPVDSPLHLHFEWDDSVASEKWREEQARNLIRSINIEVNVGVPVTVRAYVSCPADRAEGRGYREFNEVITSDFLRRQFAEEMERQIAVWQKRADTLGACINFSAMTKTVQQLKKAAK